MNLIAIKTTPIQAIINFFARLEAQRQANIETARQAELELAYQAKLKLEAAAINEAFMIIGDASIECMYAEYGFVVANFDTISDEKVKVFASYHDGMINYMIGDGTYFETRMTMDADLAVEILATNILNY